MNPVEPLQDQLQTQMALSGMAYILVVLVCIFLAWWSLQQFRFDLFLRSPKSAPAKMLQVVLSIAIGYQLARFVIDYFNWSRLLQGMF